MIQSALVIFLTTFANAGLLAHEGHHVNASGFAHQAEHILANGLFLVAIVIIVFKLFSVLKGLYWQKAKRIE